MKEYSSLKAIQQELQGGSLTCSQLVEHYLENIDKKVDLNAFLETYSNEARQQAQVVDQKIAENRAGKLAGMVIGIKDVLCYQNHPLQCSSKILDGFESQFTATAVQRLLNEDVIIIGRQNCDEFAMGSSNENSAFGVVRNATNPAHVPGGSSGGSAVAVQADMCLVSLGSDTGGSVRQPAAFCGVVGLKPSYGRISRYGLAAYASSFDCIGIFGKNIADVALVLEVMAGADEFDTTVSKKSVPEYSKALSFDRKAKVAYLKETLESEGLHPEVKQATQATLDFLKTEGHTVESVDFPLLDYILPTYYILTTAEASSNLSRYDGVRYGFRSTSAEDLQQMYTQTRTEGFGAEVKRRILLGTYVLSASYYDAYYTQAQKVRRLIKDATDKLFEQYDFIVLPTTPNTAFEIGAHNDNLVEMYLEDLFTVQANVVGVPAISIPNGRATNGLPIGLQVMAATYQEDDLLSFSQYLLES
ncbi:Asp-tRNA(Asn)/Glu-tRNA(Gln) amidotransferase subunit GatA [uncultured Microscilla sp.]|uniref:Asp-tRNA(Asn)/Glu-tRNA(Gln) amidotransferase subunit GatA n=1 Tax=uncultured Microscilla sp. TaxID=432653 RepID=UPI00260B3846|nr:Asp-tRNA(Asn)/Glu-tRNA(Gln) amidotransferase subunit GatA [uncultured Microscilla sp.]